MTHGLDSVTPQNRVRFYLQKNTVLCGRSMSLNKCFRGKDCDHLVKFKMYSDFIMPSVFAKSAQKQAYGLRLNYKTKANKDFHTAKWSIVKFENCKGNAAQLLCKLCPFSEHRDNVHMSMP